MRHLCILLSPLLLMTACGTSQAPTTLPVSSDSTVPLPTATPVFPQYAKIELNFPAKTAYADFYDPAVVNVKAAITPPSGGIINVTGFFYEDFGLGASSTAAIYPAGPNPLQADTGQQVSALIDGPITTPAALSQSWRVRFTPAQTGTYNYSVTLTDKKGTATLGTGSFVVNALEGSGVTGPGGADLAVPLDLSQRTDGIPDMAQVPDMANGVPDLGGTLLAPPGDMGLNLGPPPVPVAGFINASGGRFVRPDGSTLTLIGMNNPWVANAKGLSQAFSSLARDGGNFLRLWTCATDSNSTEVTNNPNVMCSSAIDQLNSQLLDNLFSTAEASKVYLALVMKHHNKSVYSALDQKFMRYAVARWGYSTSLLTWEFCRAGCTNPTVVNAWAADIKSQDPYNHLRSTGLGTPGTADSAYAKDAAAIWSNPLLGIIQMRADAWDCQLGQSGYPGFDAAAADPGLHLLLFLKANAAAINSYDKPIMLGESSLHHCGSVANLENDAEQSTFYVQDRLHLITHSQILSAYLGTKQALAPQQKASALNILADEVSLFPAMRIVTELVGDMPADAEIFTNYKDSSQAVAESGIWVMGRKGSNFAAFRVQNTTQTWVNVYQGRKPVKPAGGTVRLLGMTPKTYTALALDGHTGALVGHTTVTAGPSGLTLTLPSGLVNDMLVVVR